MPRRSGSAVTGLRQVTRGGHRVLDVDHPPLAAQPLPVEAAVSGGTAVVHVDHADAPAGEVRLLDVEPADRVGGRPAVHPDHVRRPLVRRAGRIRVGRRVDQRVHHPAVLAVHLHLARDREIGLVGHVVDVAAQHVHAGRGQVDPDHRQRVRGPARQAGDHPAVRGHARLELGQRQVEARSARRSPGPAARAACPRGRAPRRAGRHRAGRRAGRPAATAARRTPPRPGTAPAAAHRPARPGRCSTTRSSPWPRTGWCRPATPGPAPTRSCRP